MCFIWNPTFDAVFCSYMWIAHVTLCAVGLQWHKMNRKYPDHPSSSLHTTAVEEKQTSHRLLFVFFFGLFMPWYEGICNRFYCRQWCDSRAGIFKWNFDNFLWETGWNVKESRLMCGSHARLMYRILFDLPENLNIQINISFTNCLKCGNFRVIFNMWRNLDYCVAPVHD